jgi:hypothetical protein
MTLSRITVLIKQIPEWSRSLITPADVKYVIKAHMNDGQVIDYFSRKAQERGAVRPKIVVEGFCAG